MLMKKKILIVSNNKLPKFVLNIAKNLSFDNFSIHFLVTRQKDVDIFFGSSVKGFYFIPTTKTKFYYLLFLLFFPIIYLRALWILINNYKKKNEIDTIVCFGTQAKIIFTPLAKLLKIPCLWLEDTLIKKPNKVILFLLKVLSKWTKVIAFTNINAYSLKRIKINNIFIVPPGLCLRDLKVQNNLFSEIANLNNKKQKRFFVVGTITNLDNKNKIEALCQAVNKSLSIIPNIQLIVVGDGKFGPKNSPWTRWLNKKMSIENLCWFVGEQKNIKKWLENFDLFVFLDNFLKFSDFVAVLGAMATNVPIIGLDKSGIEDLITNNKSGLLLESLSSEELSTAIIRLYKNPFLRKQFVQRAYDDYQKYFTINNTINELKRHF